MEGSGERPWAPARSAELGAGFCPAEGCLAAQGGAVGAPPTGAGADIMAHIIARGLGMPALARASTTAESARSRALSLRGPESAGRGQCKCVPSKLPFRNVTIPLS